MKNTTRPVCGFNKTSDADIDGRNETTRGLMMTDPSRENQLVSRSTILPA